MAHLQVRQRAREAGEDALRFLKLGLGLGGAAGGHLPLQLLHGGRRLLRLLRLHTGRRLFAS